MRYSTHTDSVHTRSLAARSQKLHGPPHALPEYIILYSNGDARLRRGHGGRGGAQARPAARRDTARRPHRRPQRPRRPRRRRAVGGGGRSTSSPPSSSAAPGPSWRRERGDEQRCAPTADRRRAAGVCGGVRDGVWKGCEGRRRGTASPLSLIWVGEAPASAGAEEPRRRIGAGSTASASGGAATTTATVARGDALRKVSAEPRARARCSCRSLPPRTRVHIITC